MKAFYIKNRKKNPPLTHNLIYLAQIAELNLDERRKDLLIEATAFNIESRYPDSETEKVDIDYAREKYKQAKEVLNWIEEKLKK